MDREQRRVLWQVDPVFGIKDRLFLYSGPIGLILVFSYWRWGVAVLLLAVPVLWQWKERHLRRIMAELESEAPPPIVPSLAAAHDSVFARQIASEDRLARDGSDWPGRDQYGFPALQFQGRVWLDGDSAWRKASVEATLSPGVITTDPNLNFRVETASGEPVAWGSSLYLLARPDVKHNLPVFELRWLDPRNYQQRVGLIASGDEDVLLLAAHTENVVSELRALLPPDDPAAQTLDKRWSAEPTPLEPPSDPGA